MFYKNPGGETEEVCFALKVWQTSLLRVLLFFSFSYSLLKNKNKCTLYNDKHIKLHFLWHDSFIL